jgi:hypothetical protein
MVGYCRPALGLEEEKVGFRLFRRFGIAPGLTLNVSKRGVSVSAGVRGAHVTLNGRGEITGTDAG